ncbi:MAG: M23 family metallopeptidase [Micromonosporaceae bacterium]
MKKRIALITGLASTLVLLCCAGGTFALLSGFAGQDSLPMANAAGCGDSKPIKLNGPLPRVRGYSGEQVRNAAIIVEVGRKMEVPPRGWVIAVATALQESSLHNLGHLGPRNDHDSLGLFQQRPSQGWGSPKQLTDPQYAATKFYQKLKKIRGWQNMRLTDAAQAVQGSAFPDAYQKWEEPATEIVNVLTGGAGRAAVNANPADLKCAAAGAVSASGWTVPSTGSLGGGFRTSERPTHDGVDIVASRGTPVRAASAGVVTEVMCNASTGNCDVDGSPAVLGCGWYVDIKHAGNVITRYCHMLSRPMVSVGDRVGPGQQLGKVGSSGNSSGPHLHFEVHLGGDAGSLGAVDPVPFMAAKGASLTRAG